MSGTYEKDISDEDKKHLKRKRYYDLGFHPDVDVDKFHSGMKLNKSSFYNVGFWSYKS